MHDKEEMWEKLGRTITGIHAKRFNEELTKLEGKDYIQAYIQVLEFFAPKLARKEIKHSLTDDERIITIEIVGSEAKEIENKKVKLIENVIDEAKDD